MQRHHVRTSLALGLALTLLATSAAVAQQRGQGRGFGFFGGQGGKAALLRQETVQQDLKLSDDQQTKVEDLLRTSREKAREAFQGLGRDASQEDRQQAREKLEGLNAETEKQLNDILTAEQQKRLDQIALQAAGTRALARKEVAEKLQLTSDQQQQIRQAFEQADAKRRELFTGGQRDENAREKMQQIRDESDKQVLAVLTDAQKKQFDQMKGKTVELRFGFGGRGNRSNRENRD